VVEHSTPNPEIEGSKPGEIRREKSTVLGKDKAITYN
jgi:hypothetical protein